MYGPHALVVLQGTRPNADMANEVWQIGIRVAKPVTGSTPDFVPDPEGYLDIIVPQIHTWFMLSSTKMSPNAYLKTIKCNNIAPDGTYLDDVVHTRAVGPWAGGAPADTVPGFCSLAYTFHTARGTGTARYGRCYPPNNTYALVPSVSVSTADRDANANAAKGLLDALLPSDFSIAAHVASRSSGIVEPITHASSDSVWDVQRRRKNRAIHTRSALLAP